jgi:hypothetical protein
MHAALDRQSGGPLRLAGRPLRWLIAGMLAACLVMALGHSARAQSVAAKWIEQSTFVVSSLETGRIGYIEAWGGSEFGYSYSYTLSGQPAGVSVDRDTGALYLGTFMSVGVHQFQVVVANRKAPSVVSRFTVALNVKKGVTANRTGDQILHKTYRVDSGAFGKPKGTDYTQVLLNIQKAVLADQIAAGDGKLRATILFRRGVTYNYTNNSWSGGMQYVTIAPDPGFNPRGPRPRLRNIRGSFVFDSELAIFSSGAGTAFEQPPSTLKSLSPPIFSAEPGQNFVNLRSSANASKIKVGRWYLIGSYDQQVGGFPPNIRYFDFVRVTRVSGSKISLDRRLRHHHKDNYFESPGVAASLGIARIIPLDLGGPGGLKPTDPMRFTQRMTVGSIEFVKNPSTGNRSNVVVYIASTLDAFFQNCIIPRPVPSIVAHMMFLGGTIQTSEPDKIISTLIFDRLTSGEVGGATGVEYLLIRGSKMEPINVSPRQLRMINSTIDATTNRHLYYPVTWAYNGPVLLAEFEGTNFAVNPTSGDPRIMPAIQRASARLGQDAAWKGSTLVIPRGSARFLDWQVWIFAGAIICGDPTCTSWGIIREVLAPPGGTASWYRVEWKAGTKPTTGTVSAKRGYMLRIDGNSRLLGISAWNAQSGGFVLQSLPVSFGASRTGPYPPLNSSFH